MFVRAGVKTTYYEILWQWPLCTIPIIESYINPQNHSLSVYCIAVFILLSPTDYPDTFTNSWLWFRCPTTCVSPCRPPGCPYYNPSCCRRCCCDWCSSWCGSCSGLDLLEESPIASGVPSSHNFCQVKTLSIDFVTSK